MRYSLYEQVWNAWRFKLSHQIQMRARRRSIFEINFRPNGRSAKKGRICEFYFFLSSRRDHALQNPRCNLSSKTRAHAAVLSSGNASHCYHIEIAIFLHIDADFQRVWKARANGVLSAIKMRMLLFVYVIHSQWFVMTTAEQTSTFSHLLGENYSLMQHSSVLKEVVIPHQSIGGRPGDYIEKHVNANKVRLLKKSKSDSSASASSWSSSSKSSKHSKNSKSDDKSSSRRPYPTTSNPAESPSIQPGEFLHLIHSFRWSILLF